MTDAELRAAIDAGEFDPAHNVLAEVAAVLAQPLPAAFLVARLEASNLRPSPPSVPFLPPPKVKRGRGRPATPREPAPGPNGPLGRLFRALFHRLVHLPAARAAGAASRRAQAEAFTERVRAACADVEGRPTAKQVADILDDRDPADLSTIRRHLRSAGINSE